MTREQRSAHLRQLWTEFQKEANAMLDDGFVVNINNSRYVEHSGFATAPFFESPNNLELGLSYTEIY